MQQHRFGWPFVIGSDIRAIEKAVPDAIQVVTRKKGTHPSLSAITAPDDATIVLPTAASDDSSADERPLCDDQ